MGYRNAIKAGRPMVECRNRPRCGRKAARGVAAAADRPRGFSERELRELARSSSCARVSRQFWSSAAMAAFLVRTGRRESLPWLHVGWIAALLLGGLTWVISSKLIAISGAHREVTEGITALVAAGLLLYVGFWLHSKANAARWNQFIQSQMTTALSHGGAVQHCAGVFPRGLSRGVRNGPVLSGLVGAIRRRRPDRSNRGIRDRRRRARRARLVDCALQRAPAAADVLRRQLRAAGRNGRGVRRARASRRCKRRASSRPTGSTSLRSRCSASTRTCRAWRCSLLWSRSSSSASSTCAAAAAPDAPAHRARRSHRILRRSQDERPGSMR